MNRILCIIFSICVFTHIHLNAQEINQFDDNGKQHGKWIKYFEKSEIVRYEGQFDHGVPIGEFKYYYNTGNLKTIANYENRGTVCKTVSFFGNGNKHAEGTYINREKEGQWIFYDGYNNVIATENYSKGKRHGQSITFLPTGEKIEEINYENGMLSGEWKRFYMNGNIHIEGKILNDKWNGDFTFYNMNNKKNVKGKYINSLREGDWTFYDDDGKLIKVVTYAQGKETAKKVFQKDKDTDFINLKETEEIMKKIRTGIHDNEPDNPFTR